MADRKAPAAAERKHRLIVGLWLAAAAAGLCLLVALCLPLPAFKTPAASVLYDRNGNVLATLCAENRQPVPLADIPLFLRQAVIATEDAQFYEHGGISIRGLARAVWLSLTGQSRLAGASTITQQLARTVYLDLRRTIWRKAVEAFYAMKMELKLNKDRILAEYLNQVYFGEGAYGVKSAALTYFGCDPRKLNQAEQAMLAGLLRSPAGYSPRRHPEAARGRLEHVLKRMQINGYIEEDAVARILAQPLRLKSPESRKRTAPYFVGYIQSVLAELLPDGAAGIHQAGLRVQTTLDPDWQAAAEKAIGRLATLGEDGPEGCLVALDPATGAIRAMVGGRDYERSQFNRVTQGRRQPGSAFKPFVYAAALENNYTLATLRDPRPRKFTLGDDAYLPSEAGKPFAQPEMSLRSALAASCNVVAVALGAELGPAAVAGTARRLGIDSELRPYLSLALGTSEVRPLELAGAYAAFADGGVYHRPFGIESIRTMDGRLLYQSSISPVRAVKESTAFLLTQALADVFGPGGTAAGLGPGRPAAGKTGTSDGNRDAWFAGYTPDLAAVVQIGYDVGGRRLPGSGGSLAAPVWADFVRQALAGRAKSDFQQPATVRKILICAETGELAGRGCPARAEYFAAGTEPTTICGRHRLVEITVCAESHDLPGPYCRHLTTIECKQGEEPVEICDSCRPGFLDWLEELLFPRSAPRPGSEPEVRPGDAGRVESIERQEAEKIEKGMPRGPSGRWDGFGVERP